MQIITINKWYLKTFTGYVSEINTTQIYNANDIDVVMPMHNLTEYL